MQSNDNGNAANQCWTLIPKHFPNAVLHEHIIMPNHVHGIIELIDNETNDTGNANDNGIVYVGTNDIGNAQVGAENFLPLHMDFPLSLRNNPTSNFLNQQKNEFQKMIPRSVCAIVKGYKTGVTKWFHCNTEYTTVWQRNYHEHIIRNAAKYKQISEYIIHNPTRWEDDKFFKV